MEEVYLFLKNAKTYYLGTIENGKPNIRPFGTVNLWNDKIYIQTGKIKDVYKQMKENNNIYICAMYEGKWIRINAQAIEDDSVEASRELLKNYPELTNMYKHGDGNCTTFYLENVHAKICSFTDAPIEINF